MIRQLVAAESIASQDELRRRLVRRGCDVTQATLSRDVHELRLYKGPNGYAAPNGNGHVEEEEEQPAIDEVLSSFGVAGAAGAEPAGAANHQRRRAARRPGHRPRRSGTTSWELWQVTTPY